MYDKGIISKLKDIADAIDKNEVDLNRLEEGDEGDIIVYDSAGVAKVVPVSGDVSITAAGAITISTDHATPGADKFPKLAIGEYDVADSISKTVASTAVSADNDTITATAHGFATGDCVNVTTSTTLPTGISADTAYYVNRVDAATFKLYDTRAHAVAGGATGLVNITAAGAGNHTFVSVLGIGSHYLGATLPDNALVIGGGVEVLTTCTDGDGDDATLALSINAGNDLVSATVGGTGTVWAAGNSDIVPDSTGSTAIKLTAARELTLTIAVDRLSAGKLRVWLMYIEGV
jgi:hypothetical protein